MTAPASDIAKVRLPIPQGVDIACITGPADALFRAAERRCEASVTLRGGAVVLSGPVG